MSTYKMDLVVKISIQLDVMIGFNKFTTVMQVFKRFPLLWLFQFLLAPFSMLSTFAAVERSTRIAVQDRIDRRGKIEHVEFFQYILPDNSLVPIERRELKHIGAVAVQVMFAGFGTMADWSYSTIFYLLQELDCYRILVDEIRIKFGSYDEITPIALATGFPDLNACLEESLRLMPVNNTGLPRYSPGAVVDGHYIPKGTTVQTSVFALARSPPYFPRTD